MSQKSHQSCFHHFLKKKHITTPTKTRRPNSVVLFQTHLPPGRLHPRCLQFVSSMAITSPEKHPSTKTMQKNAQRKVGGIFSKEAVGMCYSQLLTFNFCTTQFLWYVFFGSQYSIRCLQINFLWRLFSHVTNFKRVGTSGWLQMTHCLQWTKPRRMAWIREYMPIVAARDNISRLTREMKIALARKMPISYFCCTARLRVWQILVSYHHWKGG